MSKNILEIKHYTKIYSDNKKAVDDLNITVKSGEIHAFIGHNGAGKTTTIRAVVGVMDFEQGEILIDSHSIKKEPVLCKSLTAYIPDNPDLYEYITGIQYLNYICDMFSDVGCSDKTIIISPGYNYDFSSPYFEVKCTV